VELGMKNVTVTMDEALLKKARVAAAQEGKSLSKFISETVERRVGRKRTQLEALEVFLAGPLMDLTDENGKAPSRNEIYDRSRVR
jgi:metal-responsive CopG/Arc/MetJ family transcriptional regulator